MDAGPQARKAGSLFVDTDIETLLQQQLGGSGTAKPGTNDSDTGGLRHRFSPCKNVERQTNSLRFSASLQQTQQDSCQASKQPIQVYALELLRQVKAPNVGRINWFLHFLVQFLHYLGVNTKRNVVCDTAHILQE
jgi:hypothetical protein